MKKYLLLIAFLTVVVSKSHAEFTSGGLIAGSNADFFTGVAAASATVFTGSGVLDQVCISSGTGQYVVAYDTVVGVGVTSQNDFAGTAVVMPAVVLSSITITTANGPLSNGGTSCWATPFGRGVRVQNGLFLFKSAASSGEAIKASVYWRRD